MARIAAGMIDDRAALMEALQNGTASMTRQRRCAFRMRERLARQWPPPRMLALNGIDYVTAPRRHRGAKMGLQQSTEESGHVGDYHGRS